MSNYSQHVSTKSTPQSEPIPGTTQVQNQANGYAWAVDDWVRLDRFLILGNEGGSYYASERKMTREAAACVERLLKVGEGVKVVARIVEVSTSGIAAKNDPCIFALAMAMKLGDREARRHAAAQMPEVCRTGTHLFQMAEAVQAFGGWGRNTKEAFAAWYNGKEADQLAYQAVKYQQRNGWSHRDVLRLAHPCPPTKEHDALYRWVTKHELAPGCPEIVSAFEEAKLATPGRLMELIAAYNLPREALPSEVLAKTETWDALLHAGGGMPLTAMIRNLANMTRLGLIAPMSAALAVVEGRLSDEALIKRSRIHPIQVLSALLTYKAGHGARGQNTWEPVGRVSAALERAFYKAFANVEPSGARTVLALDVSGSMGGGEVAGVLGLTPALASAAMAMVTARSETQYEVMAFADTFKKLSISAVDSLESAMRKTSGINFGGTDCALPMIWASRNKVPVDTFVVYTDSETWAGSMHPSQALKGYREQSGIASKLIVVGMVANNFTIADPDDAGMMDVVGFDSSAPAAIADFSRPFGKARVAREGEAE